MSSPRSYFTRLLVLLPLVFFVPRCLAQQPPEQRWRELGNQAVQLYSQGRFAEGVPLAQEALRIAQADFGPEDPKVVTSLNNLAMLYARQGKYTLAEPLLQRALAIGEKVLGPEHPDLAPALNNLAALYDEEGKYAEAEALYLRSLAIREKALGPQHPDVAESLNNLAILYIEESKYAEAEPLCRRSLAIREKALGPDHPDVATALTSLAALYEGEGKYPQAEPLLQRSLAIREKVLRPQHPDLVFSLNNLAELYSTEGKYALAEPLLQRVLAIAEKVLGPEHPYVASTLNNLAGLYTEEGKYAQAESLFQRVLAIRTKVLGTGHPDVAAALNNLAELYRREGKRAQAEPLFLRALEIREKTLGLEHTGVAHSLQSLALFYDQEGDYARAEPLFRRALQIKEKALGPQHPDVANTLSGLAVLYGHQGSYSQAEPLFQRALQIREKTLGPDHPDVADSLLNLAGLYREQGKYAQAQPFYARAFDVFFRNLQYHFTYMSEKERLDFLATVDYRFPIYFSFVHEFRGQEPQPAGRMYDLLLWQKGLIVGSVSSMRRQVEASEDPEALKLLDQLAGKRAQIAALINQQPKDREAWHKLIEQLEAEANNLEKQLVVRSAAFAQQKKMERVTWQQVRDALKPGEAAVEFARFRFYDGKKWTETTYYVALVVTPEAKDQPQYIVLGEGRDLEGKGLVEFQQGVQARGTAAATGEAVSGAQAYALFWKPLEAALKGKRRIYLSLDGVLNQMPLGLIPAPGGKLLMEEYDLRLVSSTKDLLRPAAAPASNTAVLVGSPAFDLGATQYRAALGKLSAPQQAAPVEMAMLAPTTVSRDQGSAATLPSLPGTGAEVQAVSAMLGQHQWQATTYTADRALEEVVKQARNPRLLHIATHGFFLPDQQIRTERTGMGGDQPSGLEDPMLRSGLFFAGADHALAGQQTPEGLDDGVLTAYEATSLNLQGTELVVLSACNTGQGDVKNGEGVFGLRRGLQEAGAQAVMMSLWSVPDKETQELMTLFYSKWLSGMEKHEALRQAQLEERAVVEKRYGRDLPYYWGAFVLVGR